RAPGASSKSWKTTCRRTANWISAIRPASWKWRTAYARHYAPDTAMTTDALSLPVIPRPLARNGFAFHAMPVTAVLVFLIIGWYALAVGLNSMQVTDRFKRDGITWTTPQLLAATWSMERPVLPAPHQIAQDFYQTVFA